MASSDEEGEILPDLVTDYQIINQQNQQVSFACLPLVRGKNEAIDNNNLRIFLVGTYNDGIKKFYKQVFAWRYELSYRLPEISLLCKGNHWIKILKPKCEAAVRSTLITIQCLHFVKRNPEASEDSLWYHMARTFSTFEVAPSRADCMNHIPLIRDAAEHDKDIASSKCIYGLFSGQPPKGKALHMGELPLKRTEFIVDDFSELDDLHDDEEELFDTCCSLCDNGGNILCCEGRCMRSFHATEASGEGLCESLGLSEAQVNALPNFFCKNCQYQQHQCFICGKLGSSDISSYAEVFPCVSANCGRFYHPACIAVELQKRNDTQMEDLEEKIATGDSFTCPAHRCFVCKQVEDRKVKDMQFAVCRRCPKSYHRKCLPREFVFEDKAEGNILPRAWDDLLPKRILIYCLDHEIIPEFGTPMRDHILFPGSDKERNYAVETRENAVQKKRKLMPSQSRAETAVREAVSRDVKVHSASKERGSAKLAGKCILRPGFDVPKKASFSKSVSAATVHEKISPRDYGSSMLTGVKKVFENYKFSYERNLLSYSQKPGNADISCKKLNTISPVQPLRKRKSCSSSVSDSEMEDRITALMKDVDSSFNVDEFKKQQKVSSIYKNSQDVFDKTLTKGKVEVAVKAVQTALQKLKNGGTVDDAKAVCSPEMLHQIPLWKKKLEIYLGPFLHGMRYSSYGRHFTNLDKLQEIVDRLHYYVKDGDMIVDFCCGANDFSWLMKRKLESVGKNNCSFKNYDLFPTKNHFSFEQRDWFSVAPGELPNGTRLIMGLNPPFGVRGGLANKFISKALDFNPKLVILIVPPETRRLDSRPDGKKYDLIWQDQHLLSGKSFYLPGSTDIHDKQVLQWNNTTPPLSLWSRHDWTLKHKTIARSLGHCWGHSPAQHPDINLELSDGGLTGLL